MPDKKNHSISQEKINATNLRLIGNKMTDNLFHLLSHTPLSLNGFGNSQHKIIICLSGHDFVVKGYKMHKSGLVVRKDKDGMENIQSLLDKNEEGVVLVSQIAKKFFDKETSMQEYKSRIFCLIKGKVAITNKLASKLGKVKQVHIRR